ncbi:MAG: DUF5107 domain-containing protein [Ruminococcaceae bacterium]|nr:DUF5107 domain-containing protein [Oscillospiraceae bacterium]
MIKLEDCVIPAASIGELNPMPDIKNVSYIHAGFEMSDKVQESEKTHLGKGMIPTMLPYMMQDFYDRDKKERVFKAVVLENKYLKATFLPELGGRLRSIYDKEKKRELLYVNPVFQPGNLGLRNAWFSGGVEFNVGIKGHTPLTCSPMWCAVDKCKEGEILRLYEFERIRGVVYSVNAWLPEDSKVLYIKGRIENTTNQQKYMYWWSNMAFPQEKKTRVFVPTNDSFLSFYNENHYLLDKASIPVHEGIDISYTTNIPTSRDFFYKIPPKNHKWIAATDGNGHGLLQCSTQQLKGRKLFVWGQGQGGTNWNEWLSEEGSSNIEIQAGLAHTQLEHLPMDGNTTWEWVEAYTALEIDSDIAHGDYQKATGEIETYMLERIGNPDELTFPNQQNAEQSEILYKGSDWGAVEEIVRNERISDICKFPQTHTSETAEWVELAKNGHFPEPNINDMPKSYVTGKYWLEKLTNLPSQTWYSLLHIGVIKYADGDVDGAKKAWEESIELKPTPWALRNLSMIYKNELGDGNKARDYIMQAFALKQDNPTLCNEVAAQLTSDGSDAMWLTLFDTLSDSIKALGRIQLYRAIALIHLDQLKEATKIINPDFVMSDIKEGEISISNLWFTLYRRIYAEEKGIAYNPDDEQLKTNADKKYPLPKKLDYRMHI